MARLESVDGSNWREFIQSPVAVLVIGKSDCPACSSWSAELETFLAGDETWKGVRFGKVLLDKGGLIDFKRANPWLADIDELPFNQLYASGERVKSFPGSGIERLVTRLQSLDAATSATTNREGEPTR
jgi:hypothetical protein